MKTKSIRNTHTLANICQVAAERFKENAKMFTQLAESGGNGMITVTAAKQLAEQFTQQAREASLFSNMISDADDLNIMFNDEDWEEEDLKEAMQI